MPSLEDDLASCDRAEILEYLDKLENAEEFAGKIVRLEDHGSTMLVTVLRDGDSQEQTYGGTQVGDFLTNVCIRYQHEFRVKPYGKLQVTQCKH